jgi:hypothetical protein
MYIYRLQIKWGFNKEKNKTKDSFEFGTHKRYFFRVYSVKSNCKTYESNERFARLFCMGVKLGLALKEELRVFENRVLRRVFGLKRDEVTRGWRELDTEEHSDFDSSPSIIIIFK